MSMIFSRLSIRNKCFGIITHRVYLGVLLGWRNRLKWWPRQPPSALYTWLPHGPDGGNWDCGLSSSTSSYCYVMEFMKVSVQRKLYFCSSFFFHMEKNHSVFVKFKVIGTNSDSEPTRINGLIPDLIRRMIPIWSMYEYDHPINICFVVIFLEFCFQITLWSLTTFLTKRF